MSDDASIQPDAVLRPWEEHAQEARHEGEHELDRANRLEITSDEEFMEAAEFARALKQRQREIHDSFEPVREPLYDALQNLYELRSTAKAPFKDAESTVKRALATYRDEKERQARAEREKAIAAADDGEEGADDKVKVSDLVKQKTPEHEAIQFRERWSAELDDSLDDPKRVLCAAIAEGEAPLELVNVNWKHAHRMARALNEAFQVKGLRAVKETTTAVYR